MPNDRLSRRRSNAVSSRFADTRHSTFDLFLSPHLDDVVFSCGGQIAQLVRAGCRVRVATIFAGDPPPVAADTAHVRELHNRWGLGDDPIAARRAEDRAALQLLGASVTHLSFPDCVYRLGRMGAPLYPLRDSIFGAVAPIESDLIEDVVRALKRLRVPRDATIYLPLTAGHHVDHQIVRAAGERWAVSRWQVLYYEDYPYAEKPEEVRAALGGDAAQAEWVELDQAALAAKVAAVACYRSQISTFYADEAEMAARVRAYAQAVGSGQTAERLWRR
jgi:LmbE family N-acetylglucosaminyl deacetylase